MGNQDEFQKYFSANLKWQLEKNGLKQQDLVDRLGLNAASVSYWCSGSRIPRMDKIQMLADFFGIKVTDLLEDRSEEMSDELFKDKQLLFDKISNASAEDILKINQIADMILGGK